MTDRFLFGALCDHALLAVVLGCDPGRLVMANLADHGQGWQKGQRHWSLYPKPGENVRGVVLSGLNDNDCRRLDYYCFGSGGGDHTAQVETAAGPVAVALNGGGVPAAGQAGDDWSPYWAEITLLAGREYMDGFGTVPPAIAHSRYPMMELRAGSQIRATQAGTPSVVRSASGPDLITTGQARRPYSNYFTIEEHDIQFTRFDGSKSALVNRAAMVGGDAVTVLPYDPVRDRVLMIEQFRFAPYIRGDTRPWMLEPVAGRIDPGETPEQAVHREMAEEAGVPLRELLHVASYYPSPGAWTEYLYTYVGLADLPDGVAGVSGLQEEAEDIKSHILSFSDAMDLLTSGEAETGPLILSMLWLAARRETLRKGA